MPAQTFHFLNVKSGDCSIIEHASGHVSVVDVCNARHTTPQSRAAAEIFRALMVMNASKQGNFSQKRYPVNPIEYMTERGISSVFRFVLTHPDMDHMDGLKDFFETFRPSNFYDTDNTKEMDWSGSSPYREEDWNFYKTLRDGSSQTDSKRMTIFSGDRGAYRTQNWDGVKPGDALYTLAPTPELVKKANESSGDYHDASYVILYRSQGGRILICGDSHDPTWEHILDQHEDAVRDVDLLIAPHHGRDSARSYNFLNIVNPKLTFFGNANSAHLAYDPWRRRGLEVITNNQAGCMIVDTSGSNLSLYVTNEKFAKSRNQFSTFSATYGGWYVKEISGWDLKSSLAGSSLLNSIWSNGR